jgi:hypothetical protein
MLQIAWTTITQSGFTAWFTHTTSFGFIAVQRPVRPPGWVHYQCSECKAFGDGAEAESDSKDESDGEDSASREGDLYDSCVIVRKEDV